MQKSIDERYMQKKINIQKRTKIRYWIKIQKTKMDQNLLFDERHGLYLYHPHQFIASVYQLTRFPIKKAYFLLKCKAKRAKWPLLFTIELYLRIQ